MPDSRLPTRRDEQRVAFVRWRARLMPRVLPALALTAGAAAVAHHLGWLAIAGSFANWLDGLALGVGLGLLLVRLSGDDGRAADPQE